MSPWLSLVGNPRNQASVLQQMTPINAEATVSPSRASAFTIPLPIVAATAVPDNAPNKLKEAAMTTAICGLTARVDTAVAMEFGASVQPLTNSKARARRKARMIVTSGIESSEVVGSVDEVLRNLFEEVEKILTSRKCADFH